MTQFVTQMATNPSESIAPSIDTTHAHHYVRRLDFSLLADDHDPYQLMIAGAGEAIELCKRRQSVVLGTLLRYDYSSDTGGGILQMLEHQTLTELSIGSASRHPKGLLRLLGHLPALEYLSLQGFGATRDIWMTLIRVWTMNSQLVSDSTSSTPVPGRRILLLPERKRIADQFLPSRINSLNPQATVSALSSSPTLQSLATSSNSSLPPVPISKSFASTISNRLSPARSITPPSPLPSVPLYEI